MVLRTILIAFIVTPLACWALLSVRPSRVAAFLPIVLAVESTSWHFPARPAAADNALAWSGVTSAQGDCVVSGPVPGWPAGMGFRASSAPEAEWWCFTNFLNRAFVRGL